MVKICQWSKFVICHQFLKDLLCRSILFLIFINDLSENLTSNAKLFAGDKSLFSVVRDVNTSTKELNDDLKKVNDWAFQRKMSFNPDSSKQAQEVVSSCKSKRSTHPPLVLNNNSLKPL